MVTNDANKSEKVDVLQVPEEDVGCLPILSSKSMDFDCHFTEVRVRISSYDVLFFLFLISQSMCVLCCAFIHDKRTLNIIILELNWTPMGLMSEWKRKKTELATICAKSRIEDRKGSLLCRWKDHPL